MNGKQLKNSILQWAIQGKLVPQDPNDEPASVLLERIREEKARLVKEKKIKKDKNESIIFRGDDNSHYEKFADGTVKCIDDEIPFEIPQSWCWERWGNISFSIQYGFNAPAIESGDIKMVRISDIHDNKVNWQDVPYCKISQSEIGTYLLQENDILFARTGGTVGKSFLMGTVSEPAIYAGYLIRTRYSKELCPQYLKSFMESSLYWEQLRSGTIATAQPNCNGKTLGRMLLPIPPKNEQNRIISKLQTIESSLDKYTLAQEALDKLNADIFDKLKKSVLQEAIQGRLVPQDPNDEPASKLLERIKVEKAKLFKEGKLKKKDLVDSVIFKGEDNKYYEKVGSQVSCIDEEIPFEIPANWEWVRLGTLYQHNTGKALNGANQKGVAYEYITTSNLYWNYFVLDKLRSMPFTDEELEKCTVKKGDLLVCEGGDIGRSAIWNFDYDIRIQNHIHRLRAYTPICTMFVYYTLYLYKHTGLIGGKGIGIQGLSSNALHKLLLPLPSIAEQKRIVDKIEFVIASIMR